MKFSITLLFFFFCACTASFAQHTKIAPEERAAYLKTISLRADKIVAPLGIEDARKAQKVSHIIRDQYDQLNDVYAKRDQQLKVKNADVAKVKNNAEKSIDKLHEKYLKKLSSNLTAAQVEMVKNGMTYNVMPNTYRAYQDQILTLTAAQKQQILLWLTEAREHAIDAESADKKHAWFGKYKGKINNYLSAAGYDLKKEGVEWEKRRKAQAQINNSN